MPPPTRPGRIDRRGSQCLAVSDRLHRWDGGGSDLPDAAHPRRQPGRGAHAAGIPRCFDVPGTIEHTRLEHYHVN